MISYRFVPISSQKGVLFLRHSVFSVPFQPFCNHKIFINLNLPILKVLVEQRGMSQKYQDLLAFNWN